MIKTNSSLCASSASEHTSFESAHYIAIAKDDKRTHTLNARIQECNDEIFMNFTLIWARNYQLKI